MRTGWMLAVAVLLLAMGTSMAQAQCCGDTGYTTSYAGSSYEGGGYGGATVDSSCCPTSTAYYPATPSYTTSYAPAYDTGCCGTSWGAGWRGYRGGWRTAYYGGSCCW